MSSISSVNYTSQITKLTEEYEEEAKALPPEEQRLFRQAIAPLLHQMRQETAALQAAGRSFTLIQGRVAAFAERIQARKESFFQARKIIYKAQTAVRTDLKKEATDLSGCVVDFGADSLSSLVAKAHRDEDRATCSYAASVLAGLQKSDEETDAFDDLSYAVGRAGLRTGMLVTRIVAVPAHIAGGAVSFVADMVTTGGPISEAVGSLCKAGFNGAVALAKKHAPDCVRDAYHGLQKMGDGVAGRFNLPKEETAQFENDARALATVGALKVAVKIAKVARAIKKPDPGVIAGTCREIAERTEGALAPTRKLLQGPVPSEAGDLAIFSPLAPVPFPAVRVGATPSLRMQTFAAGGAGSFTPPEDAPSERPTAYYRPVSQAALEKALQQGRLEVGQRGGEYLFKEPTGRADELVLGLSEEVAWKSGTRGGLRRNIPLNKRTLTSVGVRGLSLDARADLEERLSALAGRPIKVEALPPLPAKPQNRSMAERVYTPTIRAKLKDSSPETVVEELSQGSSLLLPGQDTYFHATNREGLEGILRTGLINRSARGDGFFVSAAPEVRFGDYVFVLNEKAALSNQVQLIKPLPPRFQGGTEIGFAKPLTVGAESLVEIAVPNEVTGQALTDLATRLSEVAGRRIKVTTHAAAQSKKTKSMLERVYTPTIRASTSQSAMSEVLLAEQALAEGPRKVSKSASVYMPTLRAKAPLPKFAITTPPAVVDTYPRNLRIRLKDGRAGEFTADPGEMGFIAYSSDQYPNFFFHVKQLDEKTLFVDTGANSTRKPYTFRFMKAVVKHHYPQVQSVLVAVDEVMDSELSRFLHRAFAKVTPDPLLYRGPFAECDVDDTYFYAAGKVFDAKALAQKLSAESLQANKRSDNWSIRHRGGEKTEISSRLSERGRKIFHSSGDVAFETEQVDYKTVRITLMTPEFETSEFRFHYDAMSQAMQRYHADAKRIEFVIHNKHDEALKAFYHLFPDARTISRETQYFFGDKDDTLENIAKAFTLKRV